MSLSPTAHTFSVPGKAKTEFKSEVRAGRRLQAFCSRGYVHQSRESGDGLEWGRAWFLSPGDDGAGEEKQERAVAKRRNKALR